MAWSFDKVMNMSTLSPLSDLRVLEAIRRNMTAAKERIWKENGVSNDRHDGRGAGTGKEWPYRSILSGLDLLGQSHQQYLGTWVGPVGLEVILSLRPNRVVWGLQCLQELGQLRMNVGGQHRHVGGVESGSDGRFQEGSSWEDARCVFVVGSLWTWKIAAAAVTGQLLPQSVATVVMAVGRTS
jgi:hypothetical protein